MYMCLNPHTPTQSNFIHLESISENKLLYHGMLYFSKEAAGKSSTNMEIIISINMEIIINNKHKKGRMALLWKFFLEK